MPDSLHGPARERIDPVEFEKLRRGGALITDGRRGRPRYFQGQFLTAQDLTRDQSYFLARQADLGRATGSGILRGLQVTAGPNATTLRIESGHGVTPAGELVLLGDAITPDVADIPEIERLDAAFGLRRIPNEPLRTRTGLFVVALRPVEFTANPTASYPTSVTGARGIEDGDIIEAVAITLIPYPVRGAAEDASLVRARVAREIFVEGVTRGLPEQALPLAMVALNHGTIEWLDVFLVRREIGLTHEDVLGLGFSPRALREMQLLQYRNHLREVLAVRSATGQGARFAATEHFHALPPAAELPSAAIDPVQLTQSYFPPEVDVRLSLIAEDELPALIEESYLLPPIDLTLSGEDQESTSVLALVAVPRAELRRLSVSLTPSELRLTRAVPTVLAQRRPLDILRSLPRLVPPAPLPEPVADSPWRQLLARASTIWYVRQRNLSYESSIVGVPLRVHVDEWDDERNMVDRLVEQGLRNRFTHLKTRGTAEGDAEMVFLLTSPKFERSRTVMDGALRELDEPERLDKSTVLGVSERFAHPDLGLGIQQLEQERPALAEATLSGALAKSLKVPEIDGIARRLDPAGRALFAQQLEAAAGTGREAPAAVAAVVETWSQPQPPGQPQ
jgi:hypothetical protein